MRAFHGVRLITRTLHSSSASFMAAAEPASPPPMIITCRCVSSPTSSGPTRGAWSSDRDSPGVGHAARSFRRRRQAEPSPCRRWPPARRPAARRRMPCRGPCLRWAGGLVQTPQVIPERPQAVGQVIDAGQNAQRRTSRPRAEEDCNTAAAVAGACSGIEPRPPSGLATCSIHHSKWNQPCICSTCHIMKAKAITPAAALEGVANVLLIRILEHVSLAASDDDQSRPSRERGSAGRSGPTPGTTAWWAPRRGSGRPAAGRSPAVPDRRVGGQVEARDTRAERQQTRQRVQPADKEFMATEPRGRLGDAHSRVS